MRQDAEHGVGSVDAVEAALRDWHAAHPQATLAEIEQMVDHLWHPVRASLVSRVAGEAATDPRCPRCGMALVKRGRRRRRLTTHGDATLQLERDYQRCPACGEGFFSPG
jgi:YgiT-type zinc finger domain-containing protein